ncbi:Tfp pilus assembly protein FimT/FimU [Thermodesulfobacteriota bacterium]
MLILTHSNTSKGFTMIELVMVVLLIGILSVVALVKTQSTGDFENTAAVKEFKHALRYAQHKAITREYDPSANTPWGITIAANQYSIQRSDGSDQADPEFLNRNLLDDASATLAGPNMYFNGLGEPIQTDGTLLTGADPRTFTIGGSGTLTVCPETGYVRTGSSCP